MPTTTNLTLIDQQTGEIAEVGWMDDIVDFNFGKPGGIVTLTWTRDVIKNDPFTAVPKVIIPSVKILEDQTNLNLIDVQTQWVVYYPFQHCIGNFGVPFDAGYNSFSDAWNGINGGGRQYTTGQVWAVAGQPVNYWIVDGIPGHPLRKWVDWTPHGGYSNLFEGITAVSSIAQDYSNFLNEGYPNDPFGANNGAFAKSSVDYVRRERVTIKVRVPFADKDLASVKSAFSVTLSTLATDIQVSRTIVPLNPTKPCQLRVTDLTGNTFSYGVYAI